MHTYIVTCIQTHIQTYIRSYIQICHTYIHYILYSLCTLEYCIISTISLEFSSFSKTFVTIPITSSTVTPSLSSESPPLSILTEITTWVLQATPLLIIQYCSVYILDLYSSYTCVGLLYGLV